VRQCSDRAWSLTGPCEQGTFRRPSESLLKVRARSDRYGPPRELSTAMGPQPSVADVTNRPVGGASDGHEVRVVGGGRSRPGLVGVSCTAGRLHRRHDSRGHVTTERPAPSTSTDSAPSLSALCPGSADRNGGGRIRLRTGRRRPRAGPGHGRIHQSATVSGVTDGSAEGAQDGGEGGNRNSGRTRRPPSGPAGITLSRTSGTGRGTPRWSSPETMAAVSGTL
jgi:hypothetical protein